MTESPKIEFPHREENPIIEKTERYQKKLVKILSQKENPSLVLIADYDDTFTKFHYNGKKMTSSFSVIDAAPEVPVEIKKRRNKVNSYYPKYERDYTITEEERDRLMKEWYAKDLEIITELKLTKPMVKEWVNNSFKRQEFIFRNGVKDLILNYVDKHNIPLVIISAGIKLVIESEIEILIGEEKYESLQKRGLLQLIGNEFLQDSKGEEVKVKPPMVYTCNKDEVLRKEIANMNCKNILFFGDHLDDIKAVKKIDYDVCLSVGFANYQHKDVPKNYYETFDVVVEEDGDFWLIISIVEEYIKKFNK